MCVPVEPVVACRSKRPPGNVTGHGVALKLTVYCRHMPRGERSTQNGTVITFGQRYIRDTLHKLLMHEARWGGSMYLIKQDTTAVRLIITFSGLLSVDEFERFTADLAENVRAFRIMGKQQTILYDYTDAAIQPQEVIAAVISLISNNKFNSKRVALYTSGQFAKTQARRVVEGRSHFAMFEDRIAAIKWLDEA